MKNNILWYNNQLAPVVDEYGYSVSYIKEEKIELKNETYYCFDRNYANLFDALEKYEKTIKVEKQAIYKNSATLFSNKGQKELGFIPHNNTSLEQLDKVSINNKLYYTVTL